MPVKGWVLTKEEANWGGDKPLGGGDVCVRGAARIEGLGEVFSSCDIEFGMRMTSLFGMLTKILGGIACALRECSAGASECGIKMSSNILD